MSAFLSRLGLRTVARVANTIPKAYNQPILSRLFSATTFVAKYKLKSHSGAKKRWKAIASGVFKRSHAGRSHLNESKTAARKNKLGNTAYSHGSQTSKLKKLLPWA